MRSLFVLLVLSSVFGCGGIPDEKIWSHEDATGYKAEIILTVTGSELPDFATFTLIESIPVNVHVENFWGNQTVAMSNSFKFQAGSINEYRRIEDKFKRFSYFNVMPLSVNAEISFRDLVISEATVNDGISDTPLKRIPIPPYRYSVKSKLTADSVFAGVIGKRFPKPDYRLGALLLLLLGLVLGALYVFLSPKISDGNDRDYHLKVVKRSLESKEFDEVLKNEDLKTIFEQLGEILKYYFIEHLNVSDSGESILEFAERIDKGEKPDYANLLRGYARINSLILYASYDTNTDERRKLVKEQVDNIKEIILKTG